jgi:hypothetical protein
MVRVDASTRRGSVCGDDVHFHMEGSIWKRGSLERPSLFIEIRTEEKDGEKGQCGEVMKN